MPIHHLNDTQAFVPVPGTSSGRGRCVYAPQEVVDTLVAFSRSGSYHQQQMVASILSLNAGHDHKDNILDVENPLGRRNCTFYLELPGCVAEIEIRADSSYYVLNVSMGMAEKSGATNSTGPHWVEKVGQDWRSIYNGYPKLNPAGSTHFVITDSKADSDKAAEAGAKALKNSGYAEKYSLKQFNQHHTSGKGSITSYVRRDTITNPLANQDIRESAQILANTMLQVRAESQQGKLGENMVAWVSQQGGSAVLTQALNILKQRGMSFHGMNYYVHFDEIGSDADQAIMLALDCGFKMADKPFSKRLWSLTSLAVGGGHKAINHRTQAESDYTRAMACLAHANNAIVPAMAVLGGACLVTGKALAGFALVSASRKAYASVKLADNVLDDNFRKSYTNVKRKIGLIK